MNVLSPMTDEERLRRIGTLLCEAARCYWAAIDAGEIPAPPEMAEATGAPSAGNDDRILHYIKRRGAAAPKDIRLALGLSRATAQRRLAQLVQIGKIVANGKTHTLVYILNSKPN